MKGCGVVLYSCFLFILPISWLAPRPLPFFFADITPGDQASWTASYSSGPVPGFSRITPSLMTSRTSFAIRSAESVFAP